MSKSPECNQHAMPRGRLRRRTAARAATLTAALALLSGVPAAAKTKPEELPPPHRQFLEDVRWLIEPRERREFLALDHDHQREAFIGRFWEARAATLPWMPPGSS